MHNIYTPWCYRFFKNHLILLVFMGLIGCNSEPSSSFINGSFSQWEGDELIGWTNSIFSTTVKNSYLNDTSVLFKSAGNSKITQRVSVIPNKTYVVEGYIEKYEGAKWNVGLWIEGKENLGYHVLESKSYQNPTLVKVKFKADQNFVDINLGFKKYGIYEAVFNDFSMRESRDYIYQESDIVNFIKRTVKLNSFDSLHLHENVVLLTKYVNSLLITPLVDYYNFEGKDLDRENLIQENQIIRDSLKYAFNQLMPSSFLQSYLELPIKETSNAYCVKASESAHDILGVFGVMTRQIHFYNIEDIAVHQCFEYWNPYLQKWIIIDPFYGISYVNASNELIGFEELNELINERQLTKKNIVHLDIEPFYFNYDELKSAWHRVKLGRAGSERLTMF
ncbi:hypothetical protein [Fulvivirga sp.]|uniref:hypothetical protein n=1 Tax=Fulvivirga sp. TaxID=1931237 RepID=UPI0032EE7699